MSAARGPRPAARGPRPGAASRASDASGRGRPRWAVGPGRV